MYMYIHVRTHVLCTYFCAKNKDECMDPQIDNFSCIFLINFTFFLHCFHLHVFSMFLLMSVFIFFLYLIF